MTKHELRKHFLSLRDGLSPEWRAAADAQILQKLLSLPALAADKTVMLYLSVGSEPDTFRLAETLAARGNLLCAPRCEKKNCTMQAIRFSSLAELKQGAYGISEPCGTQIIAPQEIDTVIVPGCVFGANFQRIGYGKGYYDRFLQRTAAETVGICYESAHIGEVPAEETDVPVAVIVTEEGVYRRDEAFVF